MGNGLSEKANLLVDVIGKLGFPAVVVLILLGMGCWQLDTTATLQRETLTVIQQNTTAIDALRDEISDLRKER